MEIINVNSYKLKKRYLGFIDEVYKNNLNYKGFSKLFAKNFLFSKDLFTRKCHILPILVKDKRHIVACATGVLNERTDNFFVSYFEALPNMDSAVALLIRHYQVIARQFKKNRLIIGVNGHISYPVGILANNFNCPQLYYHNYNPHYYPNYFDHYADLRHEAITYSYSPSEIQSNKLESESIKSDFFFRPLDKKNFKRDILILGEICDRSLFGTPFYYQKTKEEMYSSMKLTKYVLDKYNIIFAMVKNKEVGFIISHPNFSEIIKGHKYVIPQILFGSNFRTNNISTLIINTIGVLPEYQNSGIATGLLNSLFKNLACSYEQVATLFVMNKNKKSLNLCDKFIPKKLNKYYIYSIKV